MLHTKIMLLATCVALAFAGCTTPAAKVPEVTAIDILLHPDQTMLDAAAAANKNLRENYPAGFALDADHTPHVTLLQRYVRTADLEKVFAAVERVVEQHDPTQDTLTAHGYYFLPYENLGLAGITIEPTPALRELQQQLITAVEPFTVTKGTGDAFVPTADGKPINDMTIDYVNAYVPKYSGENFNPHVTVGLGEKDFVETLVAAPFDKFEFKPASVNVFHLGNFGTAQKKLWTWTPKTHDG